MTTAPHKHFLLKGYHQFNRFSKVFIDFRFHEESIDFGFRILTMVNTTAAEKKVEAIDRLLENKDKEIALLEDQIRGKDDEIRILTAMVRGKDDEVRILNDEVRILNRMKDQHEQLVELLENHLPV